MLKWIAAAALLGFGCFHLLRHRHPRWGGMRVGAKDLTIWSFLMASAHGAGLMALPFVLDLAGLVATLVHTAGYLAVAGAVAVVVYEKLGLRLLRTAWINLNAIWAVALIVTAVLTVLL